MKKISCNVIGDLLPLYVDGVVSEDTKKLVEDHLAGCETCQKAAEEMGKELVLPANGEMAAAETRFLQKMKKTWTKRKIITAVVSVLVTAVVFVGGYAALILPEWVIPYNPEDFAVREIDGYIFVSYKKDYSSSYGFQGEDGYYLYVTHNPWTAYISPLFYKEDPDAPYGWQVAAIENEDAEVSKVYYGDFDKRVESIFGKERDEEAKPQLIWTRDEATP